MTILLADPAATERMGAALAPLVRAGDVIALFGDLGAGKTTLARGLLAGLGLVEEAPSPTFAIVQPYAPPDVTLPIAHVDLYRLQTAKEVRELGLDEYREDGALLIEWPERLGPGLWTEALRLHLATGVTGGRCLTADVPPSWTTRWSSLPPR